MRKEEEKLCFTIEEGSRQLVYGAVGSLYDERLHGKYIQMREVVEESDFVISGFKDRRIVEDTVRVSKFAFQMTTRIIDFLGLGFKHAQYSASRLSAILHNLRKPCVSRRIVLIHVITVLSFFLRHTNIPIRR